jgi:hypothetical protein
MDRIIIWIILYVVWLLIKNFFKKLKNDVQVSEEYYNQKLNNNNDIYNNDIPQAIANEIAEVTVNTEGKDMEQELNNKEETGSADNNFTLVDEPLVNAIIMSEILGIPKAKRVYLR